MLQMVLFIYIALKLCFNELKDVKSNSIWNAWLIKESDNSVQFSLMFTCIEKSVSKNILNWFWVPMILKVVLTETKLQDQFRRITK